MTEVCGMAMKDALIQHTGCWQDSIGLFKRGHRAIAWYIRQTNIERLQPAKEYPKAPPCPWKGDHLKNACSPGNTTRMKHKIDTRWHSASSQVNMLDWIKVGIEIGHMRIFVEPEHHTGKKGTHKLHRLERESKIPFGIVRGRASDLYKKRITSQMDTAASILTKLTDTGKKGRQDKSKAETFIVRWQSRCTDAIQHQKQSTVEVGITRRSWWYWRSLQTSNKTCAFHSWRWCNPYNSS